MSGQERARGVYVSHFSDPSGNPTVKLVTSAGREVGEVSVPDHDLLPETIRRLNRLLDLLYPRSDGEPLRLLE